MGKPGAYLQVGRQEHGVRPAAESVRDFEDFVVNLTADAQREQASRCMYCGVPFCQSGLRFNGARQATGCPLHNLIPETNDLLFRGRWDDAANRLALTNPFPEFTGRVCPAPCETACNLGLHDDAVTIHDNERSLSDYAWKRGVNPLPAADAKAPLVSVIGSGPAGLAAAWELARRGLRVRVYERDEKPGGLLMYGIPNMKLPKWVVERRVKLMEESGIGFFCGVDATEKAEEIAAGSAAVVLACGSRTPRRIDVPGVDLNGIHFAVDYLSEATRALLEGRAAAISAEGKDVAVIGGGDTGVDCVATALRQGARSVRQIVRAACPPQGFDALTAWPSPRNVFAQAYGQREAADLLGEDPRLWSTDTVGFADDGNGTVTAVQVRPVACPSDDVREVPAQLVLIAKGFTGPEQPVIDAFSAYKNVFLAGDARLGSTLVVAAIADALEVAGRIAQDLLA
ncbi:MAG: glutamate synthase subunit beta [Eggerthellaceae bacterium]|nr:glutamate synthase subunit beta [Eggerthellaceae bacterium]